MPSHSSDMVSKENIFVSLPQPEQGGLTPRGELISAFPSPLGMMLDEERRKIIHESLNEALTEKERQVIKLTYWDGIGSIKEIAAIMRITLQAAKQCRYRALKKLRNYPGLLNYLIG